MKKKNIAGRITALLLSVSVFAGSLQVTATAARTTGQEIYLPETVTYTNEKHEASEDEYLITAVRITEGTSATKPDSAQVVYLSTVNHVIPEFTSPTPVYIKYNQNIRSRNSFDNDDEYREYMESIGVTYNEDGSISYTTSSGNFEYCQLRDIYGLCYSDWNTVPDMTGEVKNPGAEISEDIVIYQKEWSPSYPSQVVPIPDDPDYYKDYVVTFDGNSGEVTNTISHTNKKEILYYPEPKRDDYMFRGWYTAAEGGSQAGYGTKYASDTTLYARWEKKGYTITLNPCFDDTDNIITWTGEDGKADLPDISRKGHTFNGWFTSPEQGVQIHSGAQFLQDTTLYAQWTKSEEENGEEIPAPEKKGYCITLDSNTSGSGDIIPNGEVWTDEEGKAELPEWTRDGYTFKGWSVQPDSLILIQSGAVFTGDTTLYAQWEKDGTEQDDTDTVSGNTAETEQIIITLDGNGATIPPIAVKVKDNGTVTLPNFNRTGYVFKGWYTAPEGGIQVTADTVFTDSITVYAQWEKTGGTEEPSPGTTDTPDAPDPVIPTPASVPDTGTGTSSSTAVTDLKNYVEDNVVYDLSDAANVKITEIKDGTTFILPDMVLVNGKEYRVKTIKSGAFAGNKKVKTITIPESVKVIEAGSFKGCSKLKTVELPESLTEIKASVFEGCSSLTSIEIPAKVKKIGKNAFKGCGKLKKISIYGKSLTASRIGKNAFSGISKKAVVRVPKKKVDTYAKILKKKGLKLQKVKAF